MRTLVLASALAMAVLAAATPAPARDAGFDCSKAATPVEKRICANARLSQLDWVMASYHAATLQRFPRARACLVRQQRDWLRDVRNVCKDDACLEQAYLQRLGELSLMPPGANLLEDVEVPAVPKLAWVFGPALDQVAAPPRRGQAPLRVRGRLIAEPGLVELHAGERHWFVMGDLTSDGDDAPGDALASAGLGQGEVEVRGEQDPGEPNAFAQNTCRFVYALP